MFANHRAKYNAESFCSNFSQGQTITLSDLIKQAKEHKKVPTFVYVTNGDNVLWSDRHTAIPKADTFSFLVDWQGFVFDGWICDINVEKGTIIRVETNFLD